MVSTAQRKLAILISGRGSNMEAILHASMDNHYPAEITLVISDNPQASGLQTAKDAGIEAIAVSRSNFTSKAAHEAVIMERIDACNINLVCLAGYMRLLSSEFVSHYKGRLINIHPSLLPAFKGLDTHQRAIDANAQFHGCTVHFVNEQMDGGEIIAQAQVTIKPGDTAETLAARVLIEEHKLYPQVIRNLCAPGS